MPAQSFSLKRFIWQSGLLLTAANLVGSLAAFFIANAILPDPSNSPLSEISPEAIRRFIFVGIFASSFTT